MFQPQVIALLAAFALSPTFAAPFDTEIPERLEYLTFARPNRAGRCAQWFRRTAETLRPFTKEEEQDVSGAFLFNSDGKVILSYAFPPGFGEREIPVTLMIFDGASGKAKARRTFTSETYPTELVALSAAGELLALGNYEQHAIHFFETDTLIHHGVIQLPPYLDLGSLMFDPSGRYLVLEFYSESDGESDYESELGERTFAFYNLQTWRLNFTVSRPWSTDDSFHFSDRGDDFIFHDVSGRIEVISTASGLSHHTADFEVDSLTSYSPIHRTTNIFPNGFDYDLSRLYQVSIFGDGILRPFEDFEVQSHQMPVFSPSGNLVAHLMTSNRTIEIASLFGPNVWRIESTALITTFHFSPNGRSLILTTKSAGPWPYQPQRVDLSRYFPEL